MKTCRRLYIWALIYMLLPLAIAVAAWFFWVKGRMLINIFGIIVLLIFIPKGFRLIGCARMLKEEGLQEQADREYPTQKDMDFAITGHFIWGMSNHTVIPLNCISSASIVAVNCVNNIAKSNATLTIETYSGKKIELLRYTGTSMEPGLVRIQTCVKMLRMRVPNLQIK